jgi:transcriptional regulator with XRE-family HTH domain
MPVGAAKSSPGGNLARVRIGRRGVDEPWEFGVDREIRGPREDARVNDLQFGRVVRAVRVRRRWTQRQLGAAAGVSDSLVSRIERGHVGGVPFAVIRRVGTALEVSVEVQARWRGGELDRLLNAKHSLLHESVARWFARRHSTWVLAPEVSFAIYGERGVIDLLAYEPTRRALLVVELKTQIVDVNELVGTLDRKRRLAPQIAAERRWPADRVGSVLVVAAGRTNERRLTAHATMLRAALPQDARATRAWIRNPTGRCDGIVLWRSPEAVIRSGSTRVRAPTTAADPRF